jgi:hypothetical protein
MYRLFRGRQPKGGTDLSQHRAASLKFARELVHFTGLATPRNAPRYPANSAEQD